MFTRQCPYNFVQKAIRQTVVLKQMCVRALKQIKLCFFIDNVDCLLFIPLTLEVDIGQVARSHFRQPRIGDYTLSSES